MKNIFASRLVRLAGGSLRLCSSSGCSTHVVNQAKARYWVNDKPDAPFVYPEQDPLGEVWPDLEKKEDLGVCFSGGGTRAATASVGQLRGLEEIEVLKKVRYVSAVSGGGWTATPFTFIAPNALGKFLETYTPPEDLKQDHLAPGKGSMTEAVSQAYVLWGGIGNLVAGRGGESFGRILSEKFLAPFGLGKPDHWFTWNKATADEILDRNPILDDFGLHHHHTVPVGRPFLILGGTIRHYDLSPAKWHHNPDKRIPVEYTPLYSGVRTWSPPSAYSSEPIGGGYVESFAYDTLRPINAAQGEATVSLYEIPPLKTYPLLGLGDIMGSTGAAPGEYSVLKTLGGFPTFAHWSPLSAHRDGFAEGARHAHQDGGHSENLGIMPLLARKVKRVVAFVNALEPVVIHADGSSVFPDYVRGLFGEADAGIYEGAQVFEADDLKALGSALAQTVRDQKAPVVKTTLRLRPNPRFGVLASDGETVEVLWVFLEVRIGKAGRSSSEIWKNQIPHDSPARLLLEDDARLANFPLFGTFVENRGFRVWDIIRLYPEQSTLLAHYTSWVVASSRDKFTDFLK